MGERIGSLEFSALDKLSFEHWLGRFQRKKRRLCCRRLLFNLLGLVMAGFFLFDKDEIILHVAVDLGLGLGKILLDQFGMLERELVVQLDTNRRNLEAPLAVASFTRTSAL